MALQSRVLPHARKKRFSALISQSLVRVERVAANILKFLRNLERSVSFGDILYFKVRFGKLYVADPYNDCEFLIQRRLAADFLQNFYRDIKSKKGSELEFDGCVIRSEYSSKRIIKILYSNWNIERVYFIDEYSAIVKINELKRILMRKGRPRQSES